jgi:hypothetical protein
MKSDGITLGNFLLWLVPWYCLEADVHNQPYYTDKAGTNEDTHRSSDNY